MRIYIFGACASGKTTLAKYLSKNLKTPYFTTDRLIYHNKTKFTKEELVKKVSKRKKYIMEGVHKDEWILPAIKKADLIILLDYSKFTLFKRIIVRNILNKSGKDYFHHIPKILYYAAVHKNNNQKYHLKYIKKFKKKYVIIKNNQGLNRYLTTTFINNL